MNLKILIMQRIVGVAAVCLLAVAYYVMQQADRETQRRLHRAAEALGKQAEFQLVKINGGYDLPQRFPDWGVLSRSDGLNGLCARFVKPNGDTLTNLCRGTESDLRNWPNWFGSFYREVFAPEKRMLRPVAYRKIVYGDVIVSAAPEMAIARAWHDLGLLSGLAASTLAAALAMLYATLGSALRPVDTLLSVLDGMANGDLAKRVPAFEPAELQRIADAVNRLAGNLQQSFAERDALSVKLMNVQEDERAQLARDLHDEWGQHLAGINAMAASIAVTAKTECPSLTTECETVIFTVAEMMALLRGMLVRLRPLGVEHRGIGDGLNSLAANWNVCSGGKTCIGVDVDARLDGLPNDIAVHVYRIVQECLTNSAKHADATRICVNLAYMDARNAAEEHASGGIELVVEDNGMTSFDAAEKQGGSGLKGMRERVAVLGGQMRIYTPASGGFGVWVFIPQPKIADA